MNVCSNLKRVLFYCLTVHKLDVNNNLNSLAPPLFLSIICPIHTTPSLMSSIYDWWRSVSFWICSVCFILWLHLTIAIVALVNCYWRNICSAFLFGIGSLLSLSVERCTHSSSCSARFLLWSHQFFWPHNFYRFRSWVLLLMVPCSDRQRSLLVDFVSAPYGLWSMV